MRGGEAWEILRDRQIFFLAAARAPRQSRVDREWTEYLPLAGGGVDASRSIAIAVESMSLASIYTAATPAGDHFVVTTRYGFRLDRHNRSYGIKVTACSKPAASNTTRLTLTVKPFSPLSAEAESTVTNSIAAFSDTFDHKGPVDLAR